MSQFQIWLHYLNIEEEVRLRFLLILQQYNRSKTIVAIRINETMNPNDAALV